MKTKVITRNILAIAATGALAFSLAACSGGNSTEPGRSMPSSSSSSMPSSSSNSDMMELKNLSGENTSIVLDAGFVEALTTLGLTPGTVGDATLMDGTLMFPITGGELSYKNMDKSYMGSIEHMGSGLSLTAGETMVELTDLRIDPSTTTVYGTVTANGGAPMEDVELFNIDGSDMGGLTKGPSGEWILTGGKVFLSQDAADLLNKTFGTDALKGGIMDGTMVGKSTITAMGDMED